MDLPVQRIPVQIATITDDCSITWNIEELHHVLERAHGNNIKIVIVIGPYQIGKTSFISSITRNQNHIIGDGYNETTNGATIDGPYTIEELINDRNIMEHQNIPENESLFFVDIEGYGGSLRGNHDQQFSFFSNLCVPFVGISSCVVFLCDKNENRSSIEQVLTSLNLNLFNNNNEHFNSQIVLINLIRNITNYMRVTFDEPNHNNYMNLSTLLTSYWQAQRFNTIETNVMMYSKPLPVYENNLYNVGLNMVLKDLFNVLFNTNIRYQTNNPNIICDFFSFLCNATDDFHRTFIQNENTNFYIRIIENAIQPILNSQYGTITQTIYSFSNLIKTNEDYTNLNHMQISDIIREEAFCNLEQYIVSQNIRANYLQIPEIRNFLDNYKSSFNSLILSKVEEILTFKIRQLLNLQNNIISEIFDSFANEMRDSICDDLNLDSISNAIMEKKFRQLNEYIISIIPHDTLELEYVNHVISTIVKEMIDFKAKEIVIDKILYYKARLIACISLTIKTKVDELKKTNILKYIPDDEKFVFDCFCFLFIQISDNLFDKYLRIKNIQDFPELVEIKNTMHDEIIIEIRSIIPELMNSLEKRKSLQIFVKVLIGIVIAVPTIGVIASGIGAGVVTSIAAAAATGTAATASIGGTAAILFASSSTMLGNFIVQYPEYKNLLTDKEIEHILKIFDQKNFDFDLLQKEINEMEENEMKRRRMKDEENNDDENEINLDDIPIEL